MIVMLNEWGTAWGDWFLAVVIQNTVFLALVLAALWFLRRASARVLAFVATIGVIKLAIPPFISMHWFGSAAAQTISEPVAPLLFPFGESTTSDAGLVGDLTGGLGLAATLMLVWASVAMMRLGWAFLQTVQLYVEMRRAQPVAPSEVPNEFREDFRNARLDLRSSDRIAVPLTMGLFHRRVLVPAAWSQWNMTDRTAVLRHEMAHIRRRDNLIQPLEVLVQGVFFFHPLVHLLIRHLRTWREMACDDLSVGTDPRQRLAYSQFLLDLAEDVLEPRPMAESASMLMRHRSELMKRISHQVKEKAMNPVPKSRLVLVLVALLVAAVPLSMVHGDMQQPPPPPPQKAEKPAAPEPATEPSEKMIKKGEPVPADAPPPPPPSVKVRLSGNGLFVNGKKVEKGQFDDSVLKAVQEKESQMKSGKSKKGHVIITIDNDGGVTMGKVHAMQAHLKDLGLYKVIYTGELGEAVPMVLPPDKAKEKLAKMPEKQILPVKVDGAGVVTVGGKKVAGASLPKLITKMLAAEPNLVVVLATEQNTSYGAFVQVLESLKKGGADKIMIKDPK